MEAWKKNNSEGIITANLNLEYLAQENVELKQKILIIQRAKREQNLNLKFCIYCNQDFIEKSNFNWSCRTHLQDFDTDIGMYWCCGSRFPK